MCLPLPSKRSPMVTAPRSQLPALYLEQDCILLLSQPLGGSPQRRFSGLRVHEWSTTHESSSIYIDASDADIDGHLATCWRSLPTTDHGRHPEIPLRQLTCTPAAIEAAVFEVRWHPFSIGFLEIPHKRLYESSKGGKEINEGKHILPHHSTHSAEVGVSWLISFPSAYYLHAIDMCRLVDIYSLFSYQTYTVYRICI